MTHFSDIIIMTPIFFIVFHCICEEYAHIAAHLTMQAESEYRYIMDHIANWDDPRWANWTESRISNFKLTYREYVGEKRFKEMVGNIDRYYCERYNEIHQLWLVPIDEFIGVL